MIVTKHNTTRFDEQIQLKIDGTAILKAPNLKILGVTFERNGGAETWIKQTKTQWSDELNLLRKLTTKAWGAQAVLLKRLHRTLLVSKAVYCLSYLRLKRVQEETLNVLNRSATRVITGLPKLTPLAKLEKAAQVNKVREIADEMVLGQLKRLSR
ncbi:hypothetical protein HPB47_017033 [Ixodes persulcatus]|uniref:Uncharacterized protein n=1 Tax=Ixodes persulcatus TaxID=34615 RepID=A0AC60R0Y4_IXOPE|nr:hypothetical protein HPB47_017033 [Ixodes persulcatus]